MRWNVRRISKPKLFVGLMVASAASLLIPSRFTHSAKNPLQLLAAMQWAVHDTAARTSDGVRAAIRPAVAPEEFDRVDRMREALQHQVAAMTDSIASLQNEIGALTGWRQRGLAEGVRMVPARVVAADARAWRESLLIDRGSSDGIEEGDWVVTHDYSAAPGGGERPAAEILKSECLLGRVTERTPLTSRVTLLTDTEFLPWIRVRIGRIERDRLSGTQEYFSLQGRGRGRMTVPDVPARLCGPEGIRTGDLVISSPGEPGLPLPMVIGVVDRIEPHANNPLLRNLMVSPRRPVRSVRRVYIIDPTPPQE